MERVAASARQGYVFGALVLALMAVFLFTSAPASPNGDNGAACGKVVKKSLRLTHDLLECPGDGLIVGANGITINLNGKMIDGVNLGVGIRNDGFDRVKIRNGRIQQFDYGIQLNEGTHRNLVTKLTVAENEVAGIQLSNADTKNRVTRNVVELNSGDGVAIVNGSSRNVVARNTIRTNESNGVFAVGSSGNRIARNLFTGNSDRHIRLEFSNGNALVWNVLSRGGDAAVELTSSSSNLLARNTVTTSGDAGFVLTRSSRNRLIGNFATSSSDAGVFLQYSNKNTLLKNAFNGNPAGIDLASSHGNVIESNTANANMGNGINLEDSSDNRIRRNRVNGNQGTGIYVVGEAIEAGLRQRGNVLRWNTVSRNGKGGLEIASPGHMIKDNRAFSNSGWGIHAVVGTLGGGNWASGNAEITQCFGIVCLLRAPAPKRKPTRKKD